MTYLTDKSSEYLIRILKTPTYPLAEVGRLAGISKWRARAWLAGYNYTYSVSNETIEGHQEPLVVHSDSSDSIYASFLDLIDLLFVKRFLEQGFSLQRLRKAFDEARDILGFDHFARSTFFASGSHIILQLPEYEEMIALLTGGQIAIPEIIKELGEKIDFENVTGYGLARRWYPKGKNGFIVIDPAISYGRPTVIGSGIPTENVYDFYLGENEQTDPVSSWFELPTQKVKAAINFESTLVI